MKKISLTAFAVICAICMAFGIITMTNVKYASANTAGTTPTLSATKVMRSNDNSKMLLVTAIKDFGDVYEVGYTGIENEDKVIAYTDKFYTSISCGLTTWDPEDIFAEDWADKDGVGMIIWEINFAVGTSYSFKPYALVGDRNDLDQLVIPAEEVRVTPVSATVKQFYTITFNNFDGTELQSSVIAAGETPAYTGATPTMANDAQYTYGAFTGWNNEIVAASGNATYTATYNNKELNEYTVTWIDAQGTLANKSETFDYGATPSYPWAYFEKLGNGTYINYVKVEKSTDGGSSWADASTYDGVYGGSGISSTIQPWGTDVTQFNAGLSAVTGDVQYKVTYNNLTPVTVVSGGASVTQTTDELEFNFTNVAVSDNLNRFMIHSDLLRYYYNTYGSTNITLQVNPLGDDSAKVTLTTRFGSPSAAAYASHNQNDGITQMYKAYAITSKAESEDNLYVDVQVSSASVTGFKVIVMFEAKTYAACYSAPGVANSIYDTSGWPSYYLRTEEIDTPVTLSDGYTLDRYTRITSLKDNLAAVGVQFRYDPSKLTTGGVAVYIKNSHLRMAFNSSNTIDGRYLGDGAVYSAPDLDEDTSAMCVRSITVLDDDWVRVEFSKGAVEDDLKWLLFSKWGHGNTCFAADSEVMCISDFVYLPAA